MAYLILDPDSKRILHISDTLGYQDNGNYLINEGSIAIPPSIADLVEVDAIPDEVEPEKWLFFNGEFSLNSDWVDPSLEIEASATIDELLTEMEGILNAK